MINSMTGYARIEAPTETGSLLWELRSVNHRYLDINLRLPEGFRHLEADLRQVIGARIGRGKVDATLSLNRREGPGGSTQLNLELAREILGHIKTLSDETDVSGSVSPMALLRWPGVLEEARPDLDKAAAIAADALEDAADELQSSRAGEGEKIQQMLAQRCADIEQLVARVTRRMPEVLTAMRDKMAERVKALDVKADPERLEQEIALLAQKIDVSEELDRLLAHVTEVRACCTQDKPVGRRLDFLMQELNREANTLGSKSADKETTQASVDLKVLIEQMREQVQNVE